MNFITYLKQKLVEEKELWATIIFVIIYVFAFVLITAIIGGIHLTMLLMIPFSIITALYVSYTVEISVWGKERRPRI